MAHENIRRFAENSISVIERFTGFDLIQARERASDIVKNERSWSRNNPFSKGPVFSVEEQNTLHSKEDYPIIADNLAGIAAARGWSAIEVVGTLRFRQSAWIEANARGLSVTGYAPSDTDRSDAAERAAQLAKRTLNV